MRATIRYSAANQPASEARQAWLTSDAAANARRKGQHLRAMRRLEKAGCCPTCHAVATDHRQSRIGIELHCEDCGAHCADWRHPKYQLPQSGRYYQTPQSACIDPLEGTERKRKRWELEDDWLATHDAAVRQLRTTETPEVISPNQYGGSYTMKREAVLAAVPCPRVELLGLARAGNREAAKRCDALFVRWR